MIPPVKRNVHYSDELSNKIAKNEISKEHVQILKRYEDSFLKGKDMNVFLSNNIKKSRETDFLLYTWHLYHLHMSGKFVTDISQMKNNRSDTQVLCIIDLNDVYFIDVITHPTKAEEYFNVQILEIIIRNNWIEKIGFFEMTDMIPGTLEPKITKDKDIFELYSKGGINVAFEFCEKGYCSLEPLSLNRKPHAAINEFVKINRAIYELNGVQETYKGFHFWCNDIGELLGLTEFELPTGETKYYNIF